MTRPSGLELAEIFRQHGADFLRTHGAQLSPEQRRVMRAISSCRTAVLGGHVEECDRCGARRISYNSCRNRHCPKCQALTKAQWLEEREAELLPVTYYHVVFTLPEEMAAIALQNQRVVYDLLFQATAETLRRIAADPRHLGAELGFLAVLHTWGQNLCHHPHLHCVVPGGGLSLDGRRWVACRRGFFLPVKVLSRLFRRLFLTALAQAQARGALVFHGRLRHLAEARLFRRTLAAVQRKEWVVYAKQPFGGPSQVLDYLGRYTHRVAISNHRLLNLAEGQVSFRWRDYRHGNQEKVMTLEAGEFLRRFLLHVLPRGFQRLRHYGFLSNRGRAEKLARCRVLLGMGRSESQPAAQDEQEQCGAVTGASREQCSVCGGGPMRRIAVLPAAAGVASGAPLVQRQVWLDSS